MGDLQYSICTHTAIANPVNPLFMQVYWGLKFIPTQIYESLTIC